MKIGDRVRSIKVRPKEVATVTKVDISLKEKAAEKRKFRSSYEAQFDDGSKLIFYGFNINQTIFKVEEDDGQLHLNQFMSV